MDSRTNLKTKPDGSFGGSSHSTTEAAEEGGVRRAAPHLGAMQRFVQLAGVATLALVLVAATLVAIDSRGLQTDVLVEQQATMQQLPEFSVAGTMQTGAPAPQGIPLSFQLPVPLPAPSPPAPTVITVGPRPKKAPVCKRCERQMRKIKVRRVCWRGNWRSGHRVAPGAAARVQRTGRTTACRGAAAIRTQARQPAAILATGCCCRRERQLPMPWLHRAFLASHGSLQQFPDSRCVVRRLRGVRMRGVLVECGVRTAGHWSVYARCVALVLDCAVVESRRDSC